MMAPVEAVRFGRQALRGFSQCAFQANEITGAFLVLATATFSLRMAAGYVLAVLAGTFTARLLRGNEDLLDQGLYGFNSGLIGLATCNFFAPSPTIWLWVVVFGIIAAVLTVLMARLLRFPFLAAPFILTFWAVWPLAGTIGLKRIEFAPFDHVPVMWGTATISALASALFCTGVTTGVLFFVGVAISNWRHALVALLGGFIAVALAEHVGRAGGAINSGFVGFNAVLAALAAYSIVAEDLRLVVLAALLSSWLASYVYLGVPLPVLASGFVLSIWLILLLGQLNPWFCGARARRS